MKVIDGNKVECVSPPKENIVGQVGVQWIINDEKISNQFQIANLSFMPGARTKDHIHHTSDQVVYVLEGKGILAAEGREEVVGPGTVIHIPAGEKHWHGATKDASFLHISILVRGETTHYD